MTIRSARNWLGLYFLLTSAVIGTFLLLFGGSAALPLEEDQAGAAFQVIVPVFVGQAAVIFKWMASANHATLADTQLCPVPAWAIIGPPILTISLFVLGVVTLVLSNSPDSFLQVSPDDFQNVVTLAVSILNASTILLIGRIFSSTEEASRAGTDQRSS